MSLNALAQEKFWANKAECEDAEKAYYMKLSGAKKPEASEDFDLFASDEEPAKPAPKAKPAKAEKKQPKQDQPKKSAAPKEKVETYLNEKNNQKTLVLLKPDAVHRNLMGEIICKFEERGFKLAALKFLQASEDLLKNHYADLSKKPFFPDLVDYMKSGPIVAMIWTGLNIVPMVRSMVGATKPSEAAPGSIRGDFCVDVGRNLIHASDSDESAAKEVQMWFPEHEIVQWRPAPLEWIYEDEVTNEVDGIAAIAGAGASADVVKKLNDLELENKNLKQVTNDLKAMVLKLENRVAALEKKSGVAAPAPAKAAAPAKAEESDDDDVDLFGSDEEEENDDEKNRVREERLAAYHAKKAKKPQVIAKTSVVLDIKPWDDETDMDAMLKEVKTIQKEGLVWGASKLVPVGYGINKLRIMCVVEDEKVSIDELQEQIAEFEDFVQSVDIDSMQKI